MVVTGSCHESSRGGDHEKYDSFELLPGVLHESRDTVLAQSVSKALGMRRVLFPHQVAAIQFMRNVELKGVRLGGRFGTAVHRGGILGMDPGLGKTLTTLALIKLCMAVAPQGTPRRTVVAVPAAMVSAWAEEASELFSRRQVTVFHGPDRGAAPNPWANVVITTHNVLATDQHFRKFEEGHYHRLVVDESTVVKNACRNKSGVIAKGVFGVSDRVRHVWGLSGTPHENRYDDVRAQARLTGCVWPKDATENEMRKWATTLMFEKRKADVKHIRMKACKTSTTVVQFTAKEREMYDAVKLSAAGMYGNWRHATGTERQDLQLQLLAKIVRLRQLCVSPLLPGRTLHDAPPPGAEVEATSAKMAAAVAWVCTQLKADPTSRVLVFSQWKSSFGLLKEALRARGHRSLIYEGSMSREQRDNVVNRFRVSKRRVLMVSTAAGSRGLTLTMADRVLILEPCLNPQVEQQAIQRADRIGQERDIEVMRLVVDDSAERWVQSLQHVKERQSTLFNGVANRVAAINAAVSGADGQQTATFRMKDIGKLFSKHVAGRPAGDDDDDDDVSVDLDAESDAESDADSDAEPDDGFVVSDDTVEYDGGCGSEDSAEEESEPEPEFDFSEASGSDEEEELELELSDCSSGDESDDEGAPERTPTVWEARAMRAKQRRHAMELPVGPPRKRRKRSSSQTVAV